jgi:hypothetical protein
MSSTFSTTKQRVKEIKTQKKKKKNKSLNKIECLLEFVSLLAYNRPDPAVAIATIRRRELLLETENFLCHKIVSKNIRSK